ncbi:MAG: hypothetical protein ACOVO3_03190 [Fluviicola sp.]
MKRIHLLFVFALVFAACTLTSEQEERLNKQIQRYVAAYNENRSLEVVAFTHPKIVASVKKDGDSSFLVHFHQHDDSTRYYFANPLYRETKVAGKSIQRKYWVEKYTESEEITDQYCIFALSEDNGNTWFLAQETDYFSERYPTSKRLFKK